MSNFLADTTGIKKKIANKTLSCFSGYGCKRNVVQMRIIFGRLYRPLLGPASALFLLFSAQPIAAQSTTSVSLQAPLQEPVGQRSRGDVSRGLRQVYRILVRADGAARSATGFLVSGSKIVATNHHVVEGGRTFIVGYVQEDGTVRRIPLRLLASFPQKDLAILEAVSNLPGEAMPLSSTAPEPAADLFAVGFPAGADLQSPVPGEGLDQDFFRPSVVRGTVSRVLVGGWEKARLQHQTPISKGYSGGPLLNESGVVVGVSTGVSSDTIGISYGALSSDLALLLDACGLSSRTTPNLATASNDQGSIVGLPPAPVTEFPARGPEHEEIRKRGYRMLREGNVAAARTLFAFLATKYQLAEGYVGLAATYDPDFLGGIATVGISGDEAKAAEYYAMAAILSNLAGTASPHSTKPGCVQSLCTLANDGRQFRVTCEKKSDR